MQLHACPRCQGDLFTRPMETPYSTRNGVLAAEVVCLQCGFTAGHRLVPRRKPAEKQKAVEPQIAQRPPITSAA